MSHSRGDNNYRPLPPPPPPSRSPRSIKYSGNLYGVRGELYHGFLFPPFFLRQRNINETSEVLPARNLGARGSSILFRDFDLRVLIKRSFPLDDAVMCSHKYLCKFRRSLRNVARLLNLILHFAILHSIYIAQFRGMNFIGSFIIYLIWKIKVLSLIRLSP